jgi:hypothetical protein
MPARLTRTRRDFIVRGSAPSNDRNDVAQRPRRRSVGPAWRPCVAARDPSPAADIGCKDDIMSDFTARLKGLTKQLLQPGPTRVAGGDNTFEDFSFPISCPQVSPPRHPIRSRSQNGSQPHCSETTAPKRQPGDHRTRQTERRAASRSRVDHESESDWQSSPQTGGLKREGANLERKTEASPCGLSPWRAFCMSWLDLDNSIRAGRPCA